MKKLTLILLILAAGCSLPIKSKTRIYDKNNHNQPLYDVVEYEDGRKRVFDLNNHYLPLYDEKTIPCLECTRKEKK